MSGPVMDRISAVSRWLYAAIAVANVLIFLYGGHDMNNVAIAALMVTLIFSQRATDMWRETAGIWREAAERQR